jgi:hypothetical protein
MNRLKYAFLIVLSFISSNAMAVKPTFEVSTKGPIVLKTNSTVTKSIQVRKTDTMRGYWIGKHQLSPIGIDASSDLDKNVLRVYVVTGQGPYNGAMGKDSVASVELMFTPGPSSEPRTQNGMLYLYYSGLPDSTTGYGTQILFDSIPIVAITDTSSIARNALNVRDTTQFNVTHIGDSAIREIPVFNSSPFPITITSITIPSGTQSSFRLGKGLAVNDQIPPQSSGNLAIIYHATGGESSFFNTISITYSNPFGIEQTVGSQFFANELSAFVFPDTIDVGRISIGVYYYGSVAVRSLVNDTASLYWAGSDSHGDLMWQPNGIVLPKTTTLVPFSLWDFDDWDVDFDSSPEQLYNYATLAEQSHNLHSNYLESNVFVIASPVTYDTSRYLVSLFHNKTLGAPMWIANWGQDSSKEQTFEVWFKNAEQDSLDIPFAQLWGNVYFKVDSMPKAPLKLAPGEEFSAKVHFTPGIPDTFADLTEDVMYYYFDQLVVETDSSADLDMKASSSAGHPITGMHQTSAKVSCAQSSEPLVIYPNPTSGDISIKLKNARIGTLEISDLQGRLVGKLSNPGEKINLRGFAGEPLPNGQYFLQINGVNSDGSALQQEIPVMVAK